MKGLNMLTLFEQEVVIMLLLSRGREYAEGVVLEIKNERKNNKKRGKTRAAT